MICYSNDYHNGVFGDISSVSCDFSVYSGYSDCDCSVSRLVNAMIQ